MLVGGQELPERSLDLCRSKSLQIPSPVPAAAPSEQTGMVQLPTLVKHLDIKTEKEPNLLLQECGV